MPLTVPLGAIRAAAYLLGDCTMDASAFAWSTEVWEPITEAQAALAQALPAWHLNHDYTVDKWNDAKHRRFSDVEAVFQKAIKNEIKKEEAP